MPYGDDVTEGLPYNLSNPGAARTYQLTGEAYDVSLNGLPFYIFSTDESPYRRQTAEYRKQQIDQSTEPGEQTLTGWWLRSQTSFHSGDGINYYDPAAGETVQYRYSDSRGVDIWTKGQVTLLKSVSSIHEVTGPVVGTDHQHPNQHSRSIQWGGINGVLVHDEYDVDKISPSITVSITNKALTSNIATLTTSAAHGLAVGSTITITNVDATFNGSYRIASVPTTTTFTYAKTATDVSSTAVSPAGAGVTDGVVHFIDYISGTDKAVFAICDDGVNAYWVTNKTVGGNQRLTMFKKPLSGDSTTGSSNPTASGDVVQMFQDSSIEVQYAEMEFIKDRIILCVNSSVYELSTSATALPTAAYSNTNTNYHYTSVAASGPAIYTAGHSGIYSTIQKYTLGTNGVMPVLAQAVVAAELPAGEIIEKLYYYLGYMVIGTNKGIRVAQINEQDGSLTYGPIIVETSQPVYDFAGRDRFVWAATGVGSVNGGLIRIDLGDEIENLVFAWAYDLETSQSTVHYTTSVAFLGSTNRLSFTTAYNVTSGAVYFESATELVPEGYLTTGRIRYNTLENKLFKLLTLRVDNSTGGIAVKTISPSDVEYSIGGFGEDDVLSELSISYPAGAQEYLSFKFTLSRSATDSTVGPIFKGYQIKALPAVPRQRLIQYPLACYDNEKDKFGIVSGYDGSAYDRLSLIESVENLGDSIRIQDFRNGESYVGLIEEIQFVNRTPSDKRFSGFGGVLYVTIRSLQEQSNVISKLGWLNRIYYCNRVSICWLCALVG